MAIEDQVEKTRMYALERRKNVAHVVIDEALLAIRAADEQRLACKNRRSRIDSFSYGSTGGLPLCEACVKALPNHPTEESVLALLQRGPVRPAATSMWSAGTDGAQADIRTRRVLERLAEKGLAEKRSGGWYRLSGTKREGGEEAISDQERAAPSYQGVKPLKWTEHQESLNATQKDFFDIACALGLEVGPRAPVPVLRRLIRAELERLAVGRELEREDLEADRSRVQDEQFERVFGVKPPSTDLKVERDDDGLYVEIEGTTFRGEDLPREGTWVLKASTYTAIGGHQEADIEWTGETPSGRCHARLRES